MRGKIHYMTGAVVAEVVLIATGKPPLLIAAAGILGSSIMGLLADLDHRGSTISTTFPFQPIAHGISLIGFRHRAQLHSFLAVAAIYLLLLLTGIPKELIICFTAAYTSHLLLDMLNEEGVELLWPCQRNFKFLPGFLAISSDNQSIGQFVFLRVVELLFAIFTIHIVLSYLSGVPGGDILYRIWQEILELLPAELVRWMKI